MAAAARSSIASHSITLINPPSPPGVAANREGAGGFGALSEGDDGFLYPPQSLAYAASVLRARGWNVQLIDAAGLRLGVAATLALTRMQAELIAVQVAHISLESDMAFLALVRSAMPQATLIAAGISAALLEQSSDEGAGAEYIIPGEPEAMLPALCEALAGDEPVRLGRNVSPADLPAPGMDQEGRVMDLDSLPFPAWDLVDLQRYGFATICTSRGCDDTCAFCPYAVGQGRQLRLRSAENVLQEMAWLASAFRPPRVIVRDPVFAHERLRVEDICRGMIERRIALSWECESRPEHFDAALLQLMKGAGCSTIKLGFETTGENVLRSLRRIRPSGGAQAYLEQTATLVESCRRLGLACRIFLMTGLPGQTDADISETIGFLRRVRPSAVHVKPFHRYPGLPLPPGDMVEETERGRRQAEAIQAAMSEMIARPAAGSPLRKARHWLAQRIGR